MEFTGLPELLQRNHDQLLPGLRIRSVDPHDPVRVPGAVLDAVRRGFRAAGSAVPLRLGEAFRAGEDLSIRERS